MIEIKDEIKDIKDIEIKDKDDVKDVTKVSSDIYFPSSALASNWYDGPLSKVEKTYSQTFAGQYSCSASVSVSTINAGISFSISQEVTKSTTLERPAIASNQKVNIKEFAVYDQYSFNLYNIWGNLKGSGYIYKPMGLYITQATYAK